MPRVFITQLPSRMEGGAWVPTVDIAPAREHGEPVFLVPPGMNQPTMDGVVEQLRRKLNDFTQADFILPMGDPVLMVTAAAILGARFNYFNMLKWDRHARRYFVYAIDPDAQPA